MKGTQGKHTTFVALQLNVAAEDQFVFVAFILLSMGESFPTYFIWLYKATLRLPLGGVSKAL